jgi:hypothetical protein
MVPVSARSATISPTTGTNSKPWPENPAVTVADSERAGCRAITKCSSGGLEYMRVAAFRKVPGRLGI